MPASKKKPAKRNTKALKKSSVRAPKKKSKATKKNSQAIKALHQSQDKLALALNAAAMGIWEWDIIANEVSWSGNAHVIFHTTAKFFEGTIEAYLKLIHPEDKDRVFQNIEETLAARKSYYVQHRIISPKNTVHWIEALGKVIVNRAGKPIKMMGTVQDITEIKNSDLEKEDWKIRYELLASSSGQVIYDYNIVTGSIVWSETIQEVLGYLPSQLNDIMTWTELIHPDDREAAFHELGKAQKELQRYDITYRFKKVNGDYVHINDKGFFLPGAPGDRPIRMLGSMHDITDRIKADEAIHKSTVFRKSVEATMPGGLYVYDVKNNRNVYNSGRLLIGYTQDEINAMGSDFIPRVTHPDDLNKFPTWTNEPFGEIKETEYRMRTKSGEMRWFMARNTVFEKDKNGNVTQIIGIAQDITNQRHSIDALRESEERFRRLIHDISIGVILQGPKVDIILTNKAAADLLDLTEGQLLGKTSFDPDWDIIREDGSTFPGELLPVPTAIKTLKPVRGVVMGIHRVSKNTRVWLLVNAEPILDRENNLVEVICTLTDISDRKKAEEELKESEQRFRNLQQASFGGIGLHDMGILLDCNQGLCDLTGYSEQELIGSNGINLIAPEYRDEVLGHIRSGYDKPYDVVGIRKDGSRYFVEIHGKNMPYHGRTIRVTEFRDISERKIAEEKILEQNARLLTITEDLKRKNEQLEEFTQIVSHNLRSPVGNILTLLNFFESAVSTAEKEEYLALLKESGKTTLNTLQELTDVLRIKQDKNIEKQNLGFDTAYRHARAMLNAKIVETCAVVTGDFSEAPAILYPSIYLESIFLNLLSNALKYIRNDVKPIIQFKTYYYNQQLILEASDNGLGIDLERYGHQVFKLRKTFHRHPESRGIGLFMIKNQIEAMGGEISISSKQNIGTTFFVNFNKHLQHGQQDPDNSPRG